MSLNGLPLKVLQVSAFYPAHGGGIEVVAGKVAEGMVNQGVQLTWMAGGAADQVPLSKEGLRIEHASTVDFCERYLGLPLPIWSFASLRRLWREAKAAQLIHVHDYLYFPSLMTVFFAWWLKRPVVLTQHIGWIAFNSVIARWVLRFFNSTLGRFVLSRVGRVVYVSRPVADYWGATLRGDSAGELIPNGVDHGRYSPGSRKPQSDALRFLFVGRFVEKKGVELLKSCLDIPGVQWTFIGWGPLSPMSWHTSCSIEVLENLRAEEVVQYYQQADLLVLPSKGEGFPLVVQESLACGTPVLVSDEVKQAFPQLDERCVFSVDLTASNASNRLRRALGELAHKPERLHLARPYAERLSKQWSWDACVQAYLGIYRSLVTRGNPAH